MPGILVRHEPKEAIMSYTRCLGSIVAVLACALPASGTTFTVPLPELVGAYPAGTSRYFSFDLGMALVSVQSVAIEWQGSILAGYGTAPISSDLIAVIGQETPRASYWAISPRVGASTYPQPEPFSAQTHFLHLSGATGWNLLLDGQASGYVHIDPLVSVPEVPPPIQPYGWLDSATLVIEATPVPEPGIGLLTAFAGLALLRCARRTPASC